MTSEIIRSRLIRAPMLAAALPQGHAQALPFPMHATPKLDGIRVLKVGGQVVSRQLKPLPNARLRQALADALPDGADGEVTWGATFQDSTSAVMSRDGPADGFRFHWFDWVDAPGREQAAYTDRVDAMRRYAAQPAVRARLARLAPQVAVVVLEPCEVRDAQQLRAFEERALEQGHEGVILRRGDGAYKFGRSTVREALMLKVKRFEDSEAVVTGAEELMHNDNEATVDALGHARRGARAAGKRAGGLLGALIAEDAARFPGTPFRIGTGFTAAQRRELWASRSTLIGRLVKYKYMEVGVKDAPRHPVFLGFRDPDDR